MNEEKILRQIILADLNDFSSLDDQSQLRVISKVTQTITTETQEGGWVEPHAITGEKWIEHFIPTGDGFYLLLDPSIGPKTIHGIAISLAIYSTILKDDQLSGIKIAVHWGNTCKFTDIAGNTNFVGTGMNYCARMLSLHDHFSKELKVFYGKNDCRNFVAISEDLSLHQNWAFLSKLPGFKKTGPFTFMVKKQAIKCNMILSDPIGVGRTRSYNPFA